MNQPFFDVEFAAEILPLLLDAMMVTIQATLIGFAVAAIIGLLMALGRRAENPVISKPVAAFVEFIRLTPLLIQLFFLFYVLPKYGVRMPALLVGIIGLGLHYGSYTSEVYRAGIDAIPQGQWEAATALNFSTGRTWTNIILPQAIPPMIPALGNYLVAMFKETPLLAFITVVEMFNQAKIISAQTFQPLEPYTLVGLLFFVLSFPSALLLKRLEVRLARSR